MEKKYYYVSYFCRKMGSSVIRPCCELTDIHPLEWAVKCKKYEDESYTVVAWHEITKEEYDTYADKLN